MRHDVAVKPHYNRRLPEPRKTPMNHSKFGEFDLQRRPPTPGLPLQAWDAADEYLLDVIAEADLHNKRVLIINDQFGALAIALHETQPISWSDSYTAHLALQENRQRNRIDSPVTPLPSTQMPSGYIDLVLWRLPKTVALLQQQARTLYNCTGPTTTILAAGMLKHLPDKTIELLQPLGNVEPMLAKKKARVFRINRIDSQQARDQSIDKPLRVPELDLNLHAGSNVFARDKFDIGARFFIEQFSQLPPAEHIADLGCGNGVLGIVAKRQRPDARIEFFDESYQAVAAAEKNYRENLPADLHSSAAFHTSDVFSEYRGDPFDLILCNPPFHQGHVIGDHIAWQMFAQSKKQLRKGGELWIVGNRHLQYHIKLKKIFGNCRQVAGNAKFVVLAASV